MKAVGEVPSLRKTGGGEGGCESFYKGLPWGSSQNHRIGGKMQRLQRSRGGKTNPHLTEDKNEAQGGARSCLKRLKTVCSGA